MADDPKPASRSVPDSGPVSLRVLFDGASRACTSDVVGHLADANGVAAESIGRSSGPPMATWLSFQGGWYEQNPLRFEVVAATNRLADTARKSLVDEADALVLVVACTRRGLSSARRHLWSSGLLGDDTDPADRGLVVFGHRVDGDEEIEASAVLEALGLDADIPIVMTTPEGGGIRYGFALAVRFGLNGLRSSDAKGVPRRTASSPQEIRSLVLSGATAAVDMDDPVDEVDDGTNGTDGVDDGRLAGAPAAAPLSPDRPARVESSAPPTPGPSVPGRPALPLSGMPGPLAPRTPLAPSEPALSEPARGEPAPRTPLAPSEPALSESAPIEPARSEPAPSEPAPNEPALTDLPLTDLASAEPPAVRATSPSPADLRSTPPEVGSARPARSPRSTEVGRAVPRRVGESRGAPRSPAARPPGARFPADHGLDSIEAAARSTGRIPSPPPLPPIPGQPSSGENGTNGQSGPAPPSGEAVASAPWPGPAKVQLSSMVGPGDTNSDARHDTTGSPGSESDLGVGLAPMSNRLGRDPLVLAAGVLIPVLAVILFLLVR